jgi:hypothetical protein
MITKPQRTRPMLASHRHARCTCSHDMNLLPKLRELLSHAACTADPLLIYGPQDRLLYSFDLYEIYRQSNFKTHSFRRRREAA